jgi:hypothetical protein
MIHGLVWQVKEGKRYICLGTGIFNDNTITAGRVLVYNLKMSNDPSVGPKMKMRRLGEYNFPSKIMALTPLLNRYFSLFIDLKLSVSQL